MQTLIKLAWSIGAALFSIMCECHDSVWIHPWSTGLIFHLIMTGQMCYSCWNVMYSLKYFGSACTVSHVIVMLTFSGILPERVTGGSLKILGLLS